MSELNKQFAIVEEGKVIHEVTPQDLLTRLAFLSKDGIEPRSLKTFVMWLFPRIKDAEKSEKPLDQIFDQVHNAYKSALNELVALNFIVIYEDAEKPDGEYLINITDEAKPYCRPRKTVVHFDEKRLKMFQEEVRQLEMNAPADKKGFFKGLLNFN